MDLSLWGTLNHGFIIPEGNEGNKKRTNDVNSS